MSLTLFRGRGVGTVDASGPYPAQAWYALIGEAPGEEEIHDNAPFVGRSGWRLTRQIHTVGLRREWFVCDYVYPSRPPGNEIRAVKPTTVHWWVNHLHQRVATMRNLRLLVAVGNYALYALTGKGRVSWETRGRDGIEKLSGYVFSHQSIDGRVIPVVGVMHPAAGLRRWQFHRQAMQDWEKIAKVIQEGVGHEAPEVNQIRPTMEQINTAITQYERSGRIIGIDIENPKVKQANGVARPETVCVGFGDSAQRSITIPTTLDYWKSETLVAAAWQAIRYLCDLPNDKLMHNGSYDSWVLWGVHRIPIRAWRWDTMLMEHCLDSTSGLSLGRLASRYTWYDYWKDEAKNPEESRRYTSNMDIFWEYNGKDVTRMYRVFEQVYGLLAAQGRLLFYHRHYADLMYPALQIGVTGIAVNRLLAKQREVECFLACIQLQDHLQTLTGEKLHKHVSLSDWAIRHYLYVTKGYVALHKMRGKGSRKTLSAGEVEVRKMMLVHPEIQEVGQCILDHRRQKKLQEFYSDTHVDSDGRIRCEYQQTTLAGRWKSRKTPIRTGTNNQNPDRAIREIYLPDPGQVLIEVDQSQAESRFVDLVIYQLTQHTFYRDRALSQPWERDVHTERAAGIFRVSTTDVTNEQRYMGKRTTHAWQRSMQAKTFVESLAKEGVTLLESEGRRLLAAMTDLEPEILVYFRYVRTLIHEQHRLVNSWGRCLHFRYHILDEWEAENAYREGYSFLPQSECADLQQQQAVKPLWQRWQTRDGHRWSILLHAHDALVLSADPEIAYDLTHYFVTQLSAPRTIYSVEFSMPCETKIGTNWGKASMVEFKQFPSADEFKDALQRLGYA